VSLPITTRYVRIESPSASGTGDAYDPVVWDVVEAAARAHISGPSSSGEGDRRVETDATLFVNPEVVVPFDARVTDLTTGEVYSVKWTQWMIGNQGLDHRKCGINRVQGAG